MVCGPLRVMSLANEWKLNHCVNTSIPMPWVCVQHSAVQYSNTAHTHTHRFSLIKLKEVCKLHYAPSFLGNFSQTL